MQLVYPQYSGFEKLNRERWYMLLCTKSNLKLSYILDTINKIYANK